MPGPTTSRVRRRTWICSKRLTFPLFDMSRFALTQLPMTPHSRITSRAVNAREGSIRLCGMGHSPRRGTDRSGESTDRATGSGNWLLKGLSGVRGNFHAPFFGEGVTVRSLPLPCRASSSGAACSRIGVITRGSHPDSAPLASTAVSRSLNDSS